MKPGTNFQINGIQHTVLFIHGVEDGSAIVVLVPWKCTTPSFIVLDRARKDDSGQYIWDRVYYTDSVHFALQKGYEWLGGNPAGEYRPNVGGY